MILVCIPTRTRIYLSRDDICDPGDDISLYPCSNQDLPEYRDDICDPGDDISLYYCSNQDLPEYRYDICDP